MSITITFGAWVIPCVISLLIYAATWSMRTKSSDFLDLSPIANLVKFGIATIVVLVVWLVYALVT